MEIAFRRESLATTRDECQPLIENHWKEIAINQDAIKLNPDWEAYESLQESGSLHIYTARDGAKLIGYFVLITKRALHYKDHIFAVNDIIYIDPEYRRGTSALRMIKFAERDLKERGVTLMVLNTKTHKPFDALVERLGFVCSERVYTKVIK